MTDDTKPNERLDGPSALSDGLGVESRAHEICRFIELHSGKSISLNERAFLDLCHKLFDIFEHGIRFGYKHPNLKIRTPNVELTGCALTTKLTRRRSRSRGAPS